MRPAHTLSNHLISFLILSLPLAVIRCDDESEDLDVSEDAAAEAIDGARDEEETETVDEETSSFDDVDTTDPETVEPPIGIAYMYMAVHLDPGKPPSDRVTGDIALRRPADHFDELAALTEAADQFDHKLTIMFSPQWAAYVVTDECVVPPDGDQDGTYEYRGLEYDSCLELVRAFQQHGHEIALHHHPIEAPAGWDGFTDQLTWQADRDDDGTNETYSADGVSAPVDPWFLGDITEMMALVDVVAQSGTSISSATTEEYPAAILYSAAGGPDGYESRSDPGDLVSRPCARQYGEHWVWQIRMLLYTNYANQQTARQELELALSQFADAPEPWVLGFVTHAKNIADTDIAQYTRLFEGLNQQGFTLAPVKDVMAQFGYTQSSPAQASPELRCP